MPSGWELSVNGQDWSDSQLQLLFEPSARVTAVVPAQLVDASVGSPVTVLGFGFQPGPLLLCSFGGSDGGSLLHQSERGQLCPSRCSRPAAAACRRQQQWRRLHLR